MKKKIWAVICITALVIVSMAAGCEKKPVISGDQYSDEVSVLSGDDSEILSEGVSDENSESQDENTGSGESSDESSTGDGSQTTSAASSSQGQSAASSSTASNPYPTPPANLRGTTVKYASWSDFDKSEAGKVVSDFTKKTGIKVEIIRITQPDYVTKLSARVAAKDPPDVFVENGFFPQLIPVAQDIRTGGIDPTGSQWDQTITGLFTIRGKTYIVNSKQIMFQARYLVYYNKTLFAENGIATPADYVKSNTWNWNTFLKAAREIKTAAGLSYGAGIHFEGFAAANNAGFAKYANGKFYSGVFEESLSDVWRYMLEGEKAGYFFLNEQMRSYFAEGRVGMWITDTYGLKSVGYWRDMKDAVLGFTYLPKKNASDTQYPSSGWQIGHGIVKGSRNPFGAGAFIKYYLDQDNYDMSVTYKNPAAEDFAETICTIPIEAGKSFLGQGPAKVYAGNIYEFTKYLVGSDPAQLQTNLQTVKNVVDTAISKCNEMLNKAS